MKNTATNVSRWPVLWLLSISILTTCTVKGQTIPDVQWSRAGGKSVVVSDGNIVVANGTQLIKYDTQGNQLWSVSLVAPPFVSPTLVRLSAISGGGVAAILTGTVFGSGPGPTATIFRTYDATGSILGTASETDQLTTEYTAMTGTPDGGFLLLSLSNASPATTTVRRYDRNAQLSWTKIVAYLNPIPGQTNGTRGMAATNAPDGGYVLAGAVEAVNTPGQTVGWVAKLDAQGNVLWNKLLQDFPIPSIDPNEVTKAVHSTLMITGICPAADGNGYVLAGSGNTFAAYFTAPTQTVLVELNSDGTFKRSRLTDLVPSPASVTLYTGGDGALYYLIGNTSNTNYMATDAAYQVLKIRATLTTGNRPSLLPVIAQRTFPPSPATLNNVAVAGDGGLVLSGSVGVVKLLTERTAQNLLIGTPTYSCQTGELTVTVSGGTGSPLEYQILGLRSWSANNTFSVPSYQRLGTTFTIEVRQNGQVSTSYFTTACLAVPPNGQFVLRLPDFNCQTGDLTLQYSNGDGGAVEFRVVGLRDWGTSPTFTVPTYQRVGTTFLLQARTTTGKTADLPFTTSCTTNPPPTNLPVGFGLPDLDCNNGRLIVTTVGGDNTPFEWKVPGLRDWESSALFTVPSYQLTGTTFTLYLRQSGREYTTLFTTTCQVPTRIGVPEQPSQLQVIVYPNPVGEQFNVEVQGVAWQLVQFQLTDLHGHVLQSRQTAVNEEHHREYFRLPATAGGLYLLRVSTPEQRVTVKVLKQ